MIFDDLWRAERRAERERKRIHAKYDPLIEAAQKAKNEADYQAAISDMRLELDLNDDPELIRTERLLKRARIWAFQFHSSHMTVSMTRTGLLISKTATGI
jgi:hypothetical protein